SNYQLELPREAEASEVVIFPQTSNESHGIEDLRMVRFVDDDGAVTYYGTCTAFDGYRVLPQLIETRDFLGVGVHTINGACARNKGMALFPRRIGGHYVMCSRIDGENLYIMVSDIVHFWETAELLQAPRYPWEFVQIGNCGSPLETPEGWLLLTHGVGPMRTYCIHALRLGSGSRHGARGDPRFRDYSIQPPPRTRSDW
ncbi:MAG: glycosidase, partial [Planctomycetia bacterium]|nr:glycosidase [Planctomycetia bacterium]